MATKKQSMAYHFSVLRDILYLLCFDFSDYHHPLDLHGLLAGENFRLHGACRNLRGTLVLLCKILRHQIPVFIGHRQSCAQMDAHLALTTYTRFLYTATP